MSESKIGSSSFAKSFVDAAMKEGILKSDVTVKDLLKVIPSTGDVTVAGGVLAWSGYALVYPSIAKEIKE